MYQHRPVRNALAACSAAGLLVVGGCTNGGSNGAETTSTSASPTTLHSDAQPAEDAKDLVDDLMAGNYAAVASKFDPSLAQQLSEADVKTAWETLTAELGTAASQGSPAVQTEIVVPVTFAQGSVNVRFVFDADGNLIGVSIPTPGAAVRN